MFKLLTEAHLLFPAVNLTKNDFSVVSHQDKKPNVETIYDLGKKHYLEARLDQKDAKRNFKFKDLEDTLSQSKIIHCKWLNDNVFIIVLSSALFITIELGSNGAIKQVIYDNYFIGKLISDVVVDVAILRCHIIFTFNENIATIAYLSKPISKDGLLPKFHRIDVFLQVQELNGAMIKCKICTNHDQDVIGIWKCYNGDEVHPWVPSIGTQNDYNVILYSLSRSKATIICTYRTEFDPMHVAFSSDDDDTLNIVEHKISSRGVVTVESCVYEIQKTQKTHTLSRTMVTTIPLRKQVCCLSFSAENQKLLLGCIDASVALFDASKGTTHLVKTSFIPFIVSMNRYGSIIVVANERSQMQFFDVALRPIMTQVICEETPMSNVLDLSTFFKSSQALKNILWNPKSGQVQAETSAMDSLLLLQYERHPMIVLKIIGTSMQIDNVSDVGYTPDVLIKQYLSMKQIDNAINLLLSLDWNTNANICLMSLNHIFNHLYRQTFSPEIEVQMQSALSSFHAPSKPISSDVLDEFASSVKSLSRRFFHLLVRHQLFEKAFCLAIDIADHDLFMDLHFYGLSIDDYEMALVAKNKAIEMLNADGKSLPYFNVIERV